MTSAELGSERGWGSETGAHKRTRGKFNVALRARLEPEAGVERNFLLWIFNEWKFSISAFNFFSFISSRLIPLIILIST